MDTYLFVKVTDQVAVQLVYQMFRRAPVRSNQSSLDAFELGVVAFTQRKLKNGLWVKTSLNDQEMPHSQTDTCLQETGTHWNTDK